MGAAMGRPALFIDRDGTLVHPRHYPSHPEELLLYEGVGAAIAPLQRAGMLLVVITNQSGLARGLFDEAALDRMHAHLAIELAREGVRLDGLYYCPHHPDGVVPALAITCACRKPAPGMLLSAAARLNLDLDRSWFVGDILDDVEAGNRAGCRTVLVDIGTEQPPSLPIRTPTYVARDTCHGLALIAAVEGLGPAADTMYRPQRWGAATS
jgi:D-glycero-D-manno-heptose 1,7-bisphosphate phosphatase